MGVDKALLRVDGQTLLRRTLGVLLTVTKQVMIVGDRPAYHGHGVQVVADRYPQAGALGGIATALAASDCSHVLVVACDMPFLSPAVLREMAGAPRGYDVLLPVTVRHEGWAVGSTTRHPMHAVYARHCLPALERAIEAGELRIGDVLATLRVTELTEDWLGPWDSTLATLSNVNTPEELHAALHARAGRGSRLSARRRLIDRA